MTRHLVLGLGVTGIAVVRALVAHGEEVVAVDDHPTEEGRRLAGTLGLELVDAPPPEVLAEIAAGCDAVVPSPGVPDHHPIFAVAAAAGVPVLSEFDLAGQWDDRPLVAITGTNGKTTVTELTRAMLEASGINAVAVGNTDVPLVAAVHDPSIDVFVVEASSFRLLHTRHFSPAVGTWLNVAPDHLDNHASLDDYIAAKARLWGGQADDDLAVGNADDQIVVAHLERARARHATFGLHPRPAGGAAHYHLDGEALVLPGGDVLATLDELPRAFPHDVANGLAAAASALGAGATFAGVRSALLSFRTLPHRVAFVGEAGGVQWYDDSKATAPHATLAAVSGFPSVVLIAGGRNKGLDLSALAGAADHIRAVVAIGEAAGELRQAFEGVRPVRVAPSMDEAVAAAASLARPGDVVLLSPACASYDWYDSYAHRGDDFVRAVHTVVGVEEAAR